MNSRFVVVAVLALLSVAYADSTELDLDADRNPLRKPIILSPGGAPEIANALTKIKSVLAREPLAANAIKKSEDDDGGGVRVRIPVPSDVTDADIKKHIQKENHMHRNAALARLRARLAKKLGKRGKGGKRAFRVTKSGKIVRRKTIFDDDDEKLALEKEIRLLQKLITQGRKIWTALPEKEARLAALRKKIAEMSKGKAKAAAKKKLKALLALLDKVNDKIEALNQKLKQLLKRKAAIEKQIAKYRAIIAGQKKATPKPAAKGSKRSKRSKGRKSRKSRSKRSKRSKRGKGKKKNSRK
jgi:NADH dehydrogenase/NADH:ubiquinone oxidoreductase subunit G